MTDDLIERLRAKRHVYPVQGGGDTTGRCYTTDDGYRLINPNGPEAAARIATQQEAIDELVAHIREQSTHCQTRIQDGIEIGATVWRLALEDVARENAALLSKHGERT